MLSSVGSEASDRVSCLLFFIGRAFSDGVSPSAITRRMSALAFWFQLRSECDATKNFLVRKALRGFRRGRAVRDSRRPVSFDLLLRLGEEVAGVCATVFEAVLFKLAFSLAFFGAFRISELVAPSRCRVGGLLFENMRCDAGSLVCWLPRSKTDQTGRGMSVPLGALRGSFMCPVAVFRAYVELRGSSVGVLLRHADGTFLSRFQFVQVFRKCLSRLGLEGAEFSSHSFRIGAATEAARWGLSPASVQKIGRWESHRYRLYVRPHLL